MISDVWDRMSDRINTQTGLVLRDVGSRKKIEI